jgi:hypothetical protein
MYLLCTECGSTTSFGASKLLSRSQPNARTNRVLTDCSEVIEKISFWCLVVTSKRVELNRAFLIFPVQIFPDIEEKRTNSH